MRRRVATTGLMMVAAALLFTQRAHASASAHLVYVRDRSAAACPDEDRLRQAVKQRVGYDPFFPWAKTTVVVEVTTEGPRFAAHVQLVDERNLSLGVRDLRSGATGCPGLIESTALAISIALELNAAAFGAPASEPEPSPSPPPAPPSLPSPVPTPSPSFATSPEPSADAPPLAPVVPPEQARASTKPTQVAVGIDALSVIAETPDVVAGMGLWVAARRGIGSLGLEVRADAPTGVAFTAGSRADLLVFAATLAPCAHVGPFFGCVLGSAGFLRASGSEVAVSRAGSAFALAAGARAGLELPLAPSWALRIHGDLLANVVRPAVALDGDAWLLPPLSGIAGGGVAYRFP